MEEMIGDKSHPEQSFTDDVDTEWKVSYQFDV